MGVVRAPPTSAKPARHLTAMVRVIAASWRLPFGFCAHHIDYTFHARVVMAWL